MTSWTVVWQLRWKEALDISPIDASTQFSFSYLRLSSRLERFQRYPEELVEPDSVEFEIDDSGEFELSEEDVSESIELEEPTDPSATASSHHGRPF